MWYRYIAIAGTILVLFAHRLPAPIVEQESTPPPVNATKIAKPAPSAAKASKPSRNELDRFKGTWAYDSSVPPDETTSPPKAPAMQHVILRIRNQSAVMEYSHTDILVKAQWNELPTPYNTSPELHMRLVATSEKMQSTGSTLLIRLTPWSLVDWAPKMPKSVVFGMLLVSKYVISGADRDWTLQLIGQNELKSAGGPVFHRVK